MTWRPRPPIARRSRQPAAGPGRPAKLWRDRRFAVFLTAQTLSVAGDSFALIAVPLLVLRATGRIDPRCDCSYRDKPGSQLVQKILDR